MDKRQIQINAEKLLIGLLTFLILPFLFLCFYTNPAPEDFYYANEAKRLSLWEDLRVQYKFGTGRYFQIILLYLTPTVYKSFSGYKVVCLLLMLSLFYALFLSVKIVSQNVLTLRENFLISLIIFFSYLYAMPEVVSGFYWWGGISAYHCGVILIPVFFVFFLRSEKAKNLSSNIIYTVISCLLIICIIGTNEILAILIFMFTVLLLIKNFVEKKKFKWQFLLFAVIAGIFLYLLVKAPGNKLRVTQFPGNQNFNYAFVHSFTFLAQKIFSWIFVSPLLACTLFLIPIFSNVIKQRENISARYLINPVWFLVTWLGILYISTFFSLWSTTVVLNRTLNFIYLLFLVGWFYSVFVFCNFIQKKYNISFEKHLKYIYVISFIVILFFLIKQNNIKTAFYDLLGGSAYNLNSQMNERFYQISQCSSDSCQVDSLINIPRTIFYKDITSDPNVLSSVWYGNYFNKKSITLKKSGSSIINNP